MPERGTASRLTALSVGYDSPSGLRRSIDGTGFHGI